MLKVEYSPLALEDLKRIRDFISVNWGENTSQKIIKKIIADIRRLELYPMLGTDLGKVIEVSTEYRYLFSQKIMFFIKLNLIKFGLYVY